MFQFLEMFTKYNLIALDGFLTDIIQMIKFVYCNFRFFNILDVSKFNEYGIIRALFLTL